MATVEELAKNKLAEIKQANEKKAESQKAAPESLPEKEKKAEPEKKDVLSDAEKAAQENVKLLEADDKDLSDEDKAKKAELVKKQEAKKAETKTKEEKDNVSKRIGELTGKIKDLTREGSQDKEQIQNLQKQVEELQKQLNATPEQKAQDELKKLEDDRIAKYLDEDKTKPREERREMTRDELEEWLLEDAVAATEWMTDRKIRRRDEATNDKATFEGKTKAESILKSQAESEARVNDKHPEIQQATERRKALLEEGKSPEEVSRIIFQENPKARAIAAVLRSMSPQEHESIMLAPDGPEQLMERAVQYMSGQQKQAQKESDDEKARKIAEEAAEAERQRQAELDVTHKSTRKSLPEEKESSEFYKKQLELAKRVGISKEQLDKRLSLRKKIPGLG